MRTKNNDQKHRKGVLPKENLRKSFKSKQSEVTHKSRKELRKEQRKDKKTKKHSFLLKRLGKTPEAPLKKKRRQKKKKVKKLWKQKDSVVQSNDSSDDGVSENDSTPSAETLKADEQKLKREMEEVRKKRLAQDNEEEDRNIRSLHKKLKLNKTAKVPASFRVDGLDYLLEFCNDLETKIPSKICKNSKSDIPDLPNTSGADAENGKEGSGDDDVEDIDSDNNSFVDAEQSEDMGNNSELSEEEIESDVEEGDNDVEEVSVEYSRKNKETENDHWEDIYGRIRDKEGNVVKEVTIVSASIPLSASVGKYVPPMRRDNQTQRDKIKKSLKGLLNRLSESNMHNIASQIEDLYMRNSRNEMNEGLLELLEAVLVGPVLSSDRIILEHVMLLAILHANVGTEVGAFFVQKCVQKFHKLYLTVESIEDNRKELENLVLIVSYMYHFKIIDCCLIFDLLNFLGESFNAKDVELILTILRSIGFKLRKDDPSSLKSLILLLHQKAGHVKSSNSSSRVKFMLDILLAIRNNNMSKIQNYDPSFGEHLLKVIKTFLHKGNYISELKISMQDLLNADTRGKWWIVGSAWSSTNFESEKSVLCDTSTTTSFDVAAVQYNEKLLLKAKRLGMNTDTRRNIFFILMTAEDYLDAFEKLVHLGLKNQLEREIIHVLIYCCLHERKFNPYYAILASKFCQLERRFVLTIQYTLWDRMKEFTQQEPHHLRNITDFLIHLINDRSLPITVLKVIDFSDMTNSKLKFLKDILGGILLQKSSENLEEIFIKPALSEKLHLFRESLKLFMNHFMLNESKAVTSEGDTTTPVFKDSKTLPLLKERIKVAEKAMSLGHSKVQM